MIAVVYLVWAPLGVEPLRQFIASYRSHLAGADHQLVLALNGLSTVGDERSRRELLAELAALDRRIVALEPPVLDLVAYLQVANELTHDRLCFLNSHSEILADDWLAKLDAGLDEPAAGIVGATGSWFSNRSWVLHSLGLPSAYRGLVPSRQIAREQFAQIQAEHPSAIANSDHIERSRTLAFVRNLPALPLQLLAFDSFPARHLRTNAFMLTRSQMQALRPGRLRSKMDTYRLESGLRSVTAQIQAGGLRALVVDNGGQSYEPERWDQSRTLWQARQEGLLVADNQTRLYAQGSADRRRLLSALAWGSRADPAPPAPRSE